MAARADVGVVDVLTPADAWGKYGTVSGVTQQEFSAYAGFRTSLYCITLESVMEVHDTFLSDIGVAHPPQNYIFLSR